MRPAGAIIGARNASGVGRKLARLLAEGLGAEDFVIVSGLARGIDGAAHEASLSTGTIAVVAGGVDVIYPPEHAELTKAIAERGLILSEQPPGATPTARDFPKRNRLISGLSRGGVVVEAASKSGTLITARFALEQGREVSRFQDRRSTRAVRAQIASFATARCSSKTPGDIIEALRQQFRSAREPDRDLFDLGAAATVDDTVQPADILRVRAAVREALNFTPLHRDEILREIDSPPSLVFDALLELVLAGDAEEHSGARFSLKPT